MSDAPVVEIDLDEFWHDPYPALAAMRADAPICFVPQLGATLLTRRDDIHTCEKNVAVFSSEQPGGLMNVLMGRNMMRKDGDEHRRERFVYYPAISPNKVKAHWSDRFAALTETALDAVAAEAAAAPDGVVDLVSTYATAVSGEALKIITGLTHITYQDMDAWSQAMIDGIANYGGDPAVEARCHEATAAIDAAIDTALENHHETGPGTDLLSVMIGAGMALDQVRANIKLTISGGQNEPRDAIAGAIWALLTHPDQLDLVRSGAVSWLAAFEEYCRWISPIGMSPRRIASARRHGGVQFEPDERVFLLFSAANRDEAHFVEPDRFDVTRDTSAALAFGAGPHFCAGAAASRDLCGRHAVPRFLERFGSAVLAGEVPFGGWAFRGPLSVPLGGLPM